MEKKETIPSKIIKAPVAQPYVNVVAKVTDAVAMGLMQMGMPFRVDRFNS